MTDKSTDIFNKLIIKTGTSELGTGIYKSSKNETYEGEIKNGKFNGNITYYLNGKLKYKGAWKNGKCNGTGIQYYHYNNTYVPSHDFNETDDIKRKTTIIVRESTKEYDGEWQDGKYNGKGTAYYPYSEKIKYEGEWKDDKYNGTGTKYYIDGIIEYKGEWKDYKYNGTGTQYYPRSGNKIYEGEWKDGKYNGTGTQYDKDGNKQYEGEWKDHRFNGKGTQYDKDGKKQYEGDWTDGKCNGTGKFYNENGTIQYDGVWKDNNRNGIGIQYYPDGTKQYEGKWENNYKNGTGTQYYTDGEKYEGEWKDDNRNGTGIQYYSDRKQQYEGKWKDDKYNGTGIQYYSDGTTKQYEGKWKNNTYNGTGIRYNADGKPEYEGDWTNYKRNGTGTQYYPDGEKYKGKWENNKRKGKGTQYYKDGTTKQYEGEWENSKRNGIGTSYYKNGRTRYKGEWKDSYSNGKGIYYNEDGRTLYEGEWKNNVFHGKGTEYNPDGTVKNKGIFQDGVLNQIEIKIETKKTSKQKKDLNFNEIKEEIYKLFGNNQENFEKWIENFTPTVQNGVIHPIYLSIQNIHYVFRIIQDITMNQEKTKIEADNTIEFKISDSEINTYNPIEMNHIINKFANHLYEYLIIENDMNKKNSKNSKKSLFSFLSSKKSKKSNENNENKENPCFGSKYSKLIQEMIIYSINNKTEGLLTATLPMVINNKNYKPIKPTKIYEPIEPQNVSKDSNEYKEYIKKLETYNQYKRALENYTKNKKHYTESKGLLNPEVGNTSLNVIRLIDAFISKLPFKIQNDIAIDYMINYIEGYDAKTCTFDPNKKTGKDWYASCNLGNLKKLILSLYNVLKNYSIANNSKPAVKINNQIKCKDFVTEDEKLTKLFFSPDGINIISNFTDNSEDKEIIKSIITGWYGEYAQTTNISYAGFLEFIISKWYESNCEKYNSNENFIIYNFGYMWKQIMGEGFTIILEIDTNLEAFENNEEELKAQIKIIEDLYTQTPEACKIANPMFKDIHIKFNPIPQNEIEGHPEQAPNAPRINIDNPPFPLNVGGSKQKTKKLKIKKNKKTKKIKKN